MTKAAKAKCFDAGQAAQLYGVPDEDCPFAEGTDERDAYMEGKAAPLADKWQPQAGGRALTQEASN